MQLTIPCALECDSDLRPITDQDCSTGSVEASVEVCGLNSGGLVVILQFRAQSVHIWDVGGFP